MLSDSSVDVQHTESELRYVKVVYDTSPETITRVAHGGSFLEGLKLYTLKLDEYEGLRGSVRRSVINNVHRESCIIVCVRVALFKTKLNLCKVEVVMYSCLPGLFIAQRVRQLH
jgi:hypothetical protein